MLHERFYLLIFLKIRPFHAKGLKYIYLGKESAE